jgi:hypothetical protein
MKDYNLLLDKFIKIKSYTSDYVHFEISVTKEMVDINNIIDEGLLISLIDSYSSFSAIFLIKDLENPFANLSMNIKLSSLDNMRLNEKYKMKVLLKYHKDKLILYEILFYDKENKLVKQATHLKKNINAKF